MKKFLKKFNVLLALSLLVANVLCVGAVNVPDGGEDPAPCGITEDEEIY